MEIEKVAHDLALLCVQAELSEQRIVIPINKNVDHIVEEYWDMKEKILRKLKKGN